MVYDRNIERHLINEKEVQSIKLKLKNDRKTGMEQQSRLTEADVMLPSTPKYPHTTEKLSG